MCEWWDTCHLTFLLILERTIRSHLRSCRPFADLQHSHCLEMKHLICFFLFKLTYYRWDVQGSWRHRKTSKHNTARVCMNYYFKFKSFLWRILHMIRGWEQSSETGFCNPQRQPPSRQEKKYFCRHVWISGLLVCDTILQVWEKVSHRSC